ncbi:MAG: replication-associated recombination protein A [Planctomycetota bacterium]|nr:replication-associated recombination protein A [Planctomycetota bacterium]
MSRYLFDSGDRERKEEIVPLAERMRPTSFTEFFGQQHILGEFAPLRRLIEADRVPSIILWGPPGCGKTTIGYLIANLTKKRFVALSAVTASISDIRSIVEEAKHYPKGSTLVLIDEIHRFNKAQQGALLPHIEDGTLILVGATTENPSFEVIAPLLSRCKVYQLRKLTEEEVSSIIRNALVDSRGLRGRFSLEPDALTYICAYADGDARIAMNLLEMAASCAETENRPVISANDIKNIAQKKTLLHDKEGDYHYDLISALHKSIRGSDVDASLYYLARMLEAGEDPLYVARRLVRAAAEDIGMADPNALTVTTSAFTATHFVGMPECDCILAEAVIYLATAPKSNSVYKSYAAAADAVSQFGQLPIPLHIRNSPTKLMEELGYAKGYKYPHSFAGHIVAQRYLPPQLDGKRFYEPTDEGFEKRVKERLERIRKVLDGKSDKT